MIKEQPAMNGIECWLISRHDKATCLAKIVLPALPRIGENVSSSQFGGTKKTYAVMGIEHVGFDFTYADQGTRTSNGRVELTVDP